MNVHFWHQIEYKQLKNKSALLTLLSLHTEFECRQENIDFLCYILMLSFIYSSPCGPNSNLQPPAQMTAASSISVTSEEFSFKLEFNQSLSLISFISTIWKVEKNNENSNKLWQRWVMLGWMPVRFTVFVKPHSWQIAAKCHST